MLPVNPGTIVDTVVSCIGLSVSAQRAVSPNRSLSCSASCAEYRRLAGSILIWQRSAIASTRCPVVSAIRSTNDMEGVTAYLSARTPTQSKASSATSGLPVEVARATPDMVKELRDARPRLLAAVEPAPEQPHPARELVAGIYRHDVVLDAGLRSRD